MVNKVFKNRTNLGIFSIILALIISFGITPMLNRKSAELADVIRINKTINEGELITSDMFIKIKVGALNLPKDILNDEEKIIGKYAKVDMFNGDYFFIDKLTDIENVKDYYLFNDYNDNMAISVTVSSFASGLSGKLLEGDIVTPLVKLEDEDPIIVNELMYIKVLASTTGEGLDKEEAEKGDIPETVTLSVNDIQARMLAKYEMDGAIHMALAFRGDEKKAKAYLEIQENYIVGKYGESE